MIRSLYASTLQAAGRVVERTGAERWLATRRSPAARHVRSLFAIYDLDRMVDLGLPWWTYPAIKRVDAFLAVRRAARVFEYGSGASSIWLAARAAEVHSVEHDQGYLDQVEPYVGQHSNIALHRAPPTVRHTGSTAVSGRDGYENLDFADYVGTIDEIGGLFELIVIDGRARNACLLSAIPHLALDGVIVFDNAGRKRYRAAIRTCGLTAEPLRGWCPSLPTPSTTTLLRRRP